MRYLFDLSTFNPEIQKLIQYHVNALEFTYNQDIQDALLEVHHVGKYILTLSIKTTEELDPTETIIGLNPLNECHYTFQILMSDKWPRQSHSKTT